MPTITIDEMARAGCTSHRGIRYWEQEGLLGRVGRTKGGQRRYTSEHLDRAKIIAAAQFGGWTLEEARGMVENYDREARTAIVHRLMQQATVAASLAEDLQGIEIPDEEDSDKLQFDL